MRRSAEAVPAPGNPLLTTVSAQPHRIRPDQASEPPQDQRLLAGVAVRAWSQERALAELGRVIDEGLHGKIAFCNAHVVNLAARDDRFRAALAQSLVLPDGIGVDLGSRLLHGAPFPANLNGTDFVPLFLRQATTPLRVCLLGARPGVALKAAAALQAGNPRHEIVVLGDGFFDQALEADHLARLRERPADLLLVAMGNPRQELWIASRIGPEHARLAMGVGALFDFLAGEVPRAPLLWRRLRLEWLYRLAQEPARLARRYLLGNPAFLLRMLRLKLAGAGSRP